jgi:hypothetical protein
MQRPVAGVWDVPTAGILPALAVCSICFFAGGLLGCLLMARVAGGAGEGLEAYVQSFLRAAESGALSAPDLLPSMWECIRWPLLALLLGFTALGLLGLPVLFAVRGFLLAFSIASFVRVLGSAGCLLAFLLFGVTGAISVPVFFMLGVQSVLSARRLASRFLGESRQPALYGKAWFQRCGLCAAALVVCVVLEYLVVPMLVSGLAGALIAI